jgi:hypothetical protein
MPHNHDLPSHISILIHDDDPTKYGTRMKQRFIYRKHTRVTWILRIHTHKHTPHRDDYNSSDGSMFLVYGLPNNAIKRIWVRPKVWKPTPSGMLLSVTKNIVITQWVLYHIMTKNASVKIKKFLVIFRLRRSDIFATQKWYWNLRFQWYYIRP